MTSPRISLWDATAAEPEPGAGEEGDTMAEVAVVGGGYTGLSLALHGAANGLDVLVLEAERIGAGGSGRNVGLVNAGIWLPPKETRDALGPSHGERFLRAFSDAPGVVFDLIERHQIRCEAVRAGNIHAAHAAAGLRDLTARVAEWQRMGEPVDLIDAGRTREMTGTGIYVGGLLDHRAGNINPMGYVRGLARAATAAGARLRTGVRVTEIAPEGGGWRLATTRGAVRARRVVLATNAYADALWPGLARAFTVLHFYMLASEPLGPRGDGVLPGRQGVWDTAPIMTTFRRDAEGRLLIGAFGTILGSADAGASRRWAARRIAKLYPGLGPVGFETAWHGRIAKTRDHLPRIAIPAPNLYVPVGYNGRGITTGTIFGRALAQHFAGEGEAALPVPVTRLFPDLGKAIFEPLYQAAFTANQFVRSI